MHARRDLAVDVIDRVVQVRYRELVSFDAAKC
jgi:hypothetical protein